MNIWGKIVGGALGLATGKPWFVLIGVILGHQFDRGFAQRVKTGFAGALPARFVEICFSTMGHLAKLDGRVSEEEIRAARAAMHMLGLNPEATRVAIQRFYAGKQPGYQLDRELAELSAICAARPDARQIFIRLQLQTALSTGGMNPAEREFLWMLCRRVGVGRVEFAQLEAIVRAQRGFARSERGRSESSRLHNAHDVLGIATDASDKDVKRAFRRLMNKHHPDKLVGAKASTTDIEAAQIKTREILDAYEVVKSRRGLK